MGNDSSIDQIVAEARRAIYEMFKELLLDIRKSIEGNIGYNERKRLADKIDAVITAHASEQNPQCPTCGQRVPDSLLEKIVDAVMQPAHASKEACQDCGANVDQGEQYCPRCQTNASEPLRDSPEYRDQLRSNPRTCHLTHGKPAHASEVCPNCEQVPDKCKCEWQPAHASEQPEADFIAAKHHPSCKLSDQDLMWVCAQCGLKVDASQRPTPATDDTKLMEAVGKFLALPNWQHRCGSWNDVNKALRGIDAAMSQTKENVSEQDTKRLIELMKHLAFSNHGFKPESCSECFNCNSVLSQTKEGK